MIEPIGYVQLNPLGSRYSYGASCSSCDWRATDCPSQAAAAECLREHADAAHPVAIPVYRSLGDSGAEPESGGSES